MKCIFRPQLHFQSWFENRAQTPLSFARRNMLFTCLGILHKFYSFYAQIWIVQNKKENKDGLQECFCRWYWTNWSLRLNMDDSTALLFLSNAHNLLCLHSQRKFYNWHRPSVATREANLSLNLKFHLTWPASEKVSQEQDLQSTYSLEYDIL